MSTIRLDDYEELPIREIALLSGESPNTVRNVNEATFLRQLEYIMSGEDIIIPFIGKIHIKYNGDDYIEGSRVANIDCFFAPSPILKRLVGDIQDGESDLISQLLQKKLKSALKDILEK